MDKGPLARGAATHIEHCVPSIYSPSGAASLATLAVPPAMSMAEVSDVPQTLLQKFDVHKALILAIGQEKRPLASRRAARLIATGQSAAAVLEDMSRAIQVKLYSKDDRDLACLAAIRAREDAREGKAAKIEK